MTGFHQTLEAFALAQVRSPTLRTLTEQTRGAFHWNEETEALFRTSSDKAEWAELHAGALIYSLSTDREALTVRVQLDDPCDNVQHWAGDL